MSSSPHQVLVYSGPGVSPISLSHTILTLSLILLPHYTVQPISPDALNTQPWEPACALLVIPGGRDLPFVEELSIKRKVTKRIKAYVEAGGSYLGLCAGAYFAAEEVRFDVGGEMQVVGKRDLALVPGSCNGPTYPGFAYATENGARAVSLRLDGPSSSRHQSLNHLYYNGGGHFVLPSTGPSIDVLARYVDQSGEDRIAAVLSRKGKGKALLCSVHVEYPLTSPPAKDAIAKLDFLPASESVEQSENARIEWMEDLLVTLGLHPPGRRKETVEVSGEDPAILLHPTHPSPIFVLSHPAVPRLARDGLGAKALSEKMVVSDGSQTLRDGNDKFVFSTTHTVQDIPQYLAQRRRQKPELEADLSNLSLDAEPPQPPDFHSIPKSILLPSDQRPYSPEWTPLFNINSYWAELDQARKRSGRKTGVLRRDAQGERAAVGDLLWYAETVTSTQTMIDRNPLILTHHTAPLTFLASFQLTGRGRGSNIWLSPPGCLQFSILLTLPSSLSSKIVFVQYLMALAVCDAVDDDGRLGVRVKWPNDLYAEAEGIGGTEVGSGKKGKAKLGGILVNTNFVGGQWRIVIGTGINVLNALPTTSLSQLHSLLAARSPDIGINPPTMESTFARIMNSFEQKWEQFIDEKGFSGFMDEYYGRWLHSKQEVILTTTEPHSRLRIQGITPDYGLLRCVPLDTPATRPANGLTPLYSRGDFGGDDRTSSGVQKVEYVDLQPDGNSFDLMSGLIKRKV